MVEWAAGADPAGVDPQALVGPVAARQALDRAVVDPPARVDRVAARQAALVDQVAAGRAGAVAVEVGAWAVAGMATSSTPVRS